MTPLHNADGVQIDRGAWRMRPRDVIVVEQDDAAWLCRIDTIDRAASTPTTPGLAGVSLTTLQILPHPTTHTERQHAA